MNNTELFNEIARAAKKVRIDTEAIDVDIISSTGTVLWKKGDSDECVEELGKIIALAEAQAATWQAGAVGVDPKRPSSCCELQSFDQ